MNPEARRRAEGAARGFAAWAGRPALGVWAAPGRVNLIGEHLDYNGGRVLPMAVDLATYVAAAPRDDGVVRFHSHQFATTVAYRMCDLATARGWSAYVAGMVWALRARGFETTGIDLWIDGDVPLGGGLASSAALTCAVGLAAVAMSAGGEASPIDRSAIVAAAQAAETHVAGVPVGTMDQTASLYARAGQVMALECDSGHLEHLGFNLDRAGLRLLVIDSGTRHTLASGDYAARRRECEEAAARLGVTFLATAPDAAAAAALPAPLAGRARHVLTEQERTADAVQALRDGDPGALGPLMYASHESLRRDFEVTTPALDAIVEAARAAGAEGARMIGGGFGGCVLVLAQSGVAAAVASRFPDARAVSPAGSADRLL